MWITDQLGVASWNGAGAPWKVDASGGDAIRIGPEDAEVQLQPVDEMNLPKADEQFIRGDRWNVNYPQADHHHALRIAFEAIETTADSLLLEVTLSVQTDLLDSHPKIDIHVNGDSVGRVCLPPDTLSTGSQSGSAPVTIAQTENRCTAIFLGPHDSPFTTDLSSSGALRLRLFGEFLEKGVIRKARPWILFSRSANPPDESHLHAIWQRLASRPLPLAS